MGGSGTAEDLAASLDAAGVGVFRWDVAGERVVGTGSLEQLWGLSKGELDGTAAAFLKAVHADDRAVLVGEATRCVTAAVPFRQHFRVVWPDTSVHWISARGGTCPGGVATELRGVVVEVVHSLTSHAIQERERELTRMARLYDALRFLNQAVVDAVSREELFGRVCQVLCEHAGFAMSWIGWHDSATDAIVPVASFGDTTGYLDEIKIYVDDRPEGQGLVGTAFREQRACISNDLSSDHNMRPWHSALRPRSYLAAVVLPIRDCGEIRGTLAIYASERGVLRDEEVALLAEAASNVSFALDKLARDEVRRTAEARLRQELAFSEALLRSLPGILYMYDEQGRFQRWNDNLERVSGYSAAEIATIHPLEFFAPDDRAALAAQIESVFERGATSVDAHFVAKDGTATPFHFTGVKAIVAGRPYLIGVGIDLSATRQAQAAQHESETRYRTLFDHAPDGILIADPELRYRDGNPAICRMLGYTHAELVTLHSKDLVADPALVPARLSDDWLSTNYQGTWELRRKNGSMISVDVIVSKMPDGNVLALLRDNAVRLQHERALRELNESLESKVAERTQELNEALARAEESDHLKSAFLATMSHELRTPLNSIIGFTGIVLAQMAGPLNAEQQKQLGMVRGSARHLLELINDVLDISKIEAAQLEIVSAPFSIRDSIGKVLGMVAPQAASKQLKLESVLAPGVGDMLSDRRRIEQILLNLLNNALKFTEQGQVVLSVDILAVDQAIRFRVTDTGIGIKAAELDTLFRPFRQLDTGLARLHEGTGLGLAISRRLATMLGGDIHVTSVVGRGSEFTVTLPLIGVARS